MRSQLLAVEGVRSVKVSFADKTATCTVDADVDPATVASGLMGGYSGTVREP